MVYTILLYDTMNLNREGSFVTCEESQRDAIEVDAFGRSNLLVLLSAFERLHAVCRQCIDGFLDIYKLIYRSGFCALGARSCTARTQ